MDALARILEYVHSQTYLTFPEHRLPPAQAQVRAAMAQAGIAAPERYLDHLRAHPEALSALVDRLVIGETHFFRDPEQFELIRGEIIPDILARCGAAHVLKIWSAGCASGEEPYSLAIVCHQLGLGRQSLIIGTDVSRSALARAARGIYRPWALRDVPPDILARYFQRSGESDYALDPAIKAMVRFEYHNLAQDPYPAVDRDLWDFDLIVCRNVLVYLDPAGIRAVGARLAASLAPGGWLLTGGPDPSLFEIASLEFAQLPGGPAYRRKATERPCAAEPPVARPPSPAIAPPPGPPPRREPEFALTAIPQARRPGIDWERALALVRAAQARLAETLEPSPEHGREILARRARELARPLPVRRLGEVKLDLVCFSLGRERLALEASVVREVHRRSACVRLPGSPDHLLGVTNLRGEILPVFDLRVLFEVAASPVPEPNWLVVLGRDRAEFAVVAEDVQEVLQLGADEIAPLGGTDARKGVLGLTRMAVAVLDGDALLMDARFHLGRRGA